MATQRILEAGWRPLLIVIVFAWVTPAMAAAYRGVEVGQRGDLLPAEFEQVELGQYDARFGNELIQVFVDGALVTGMKVVPQAFFTLAEALATHSPGVQPANLAQLLNWNGMLIGIADESNRIAYFTRAAEPDSIVNAIGYYNEQTQRMIFTAPLPERAAYQLIDAASRSTPGALQRRPMMNGPADQAFYFVDQLARQARTQAQRASRELAAFTKMCSGTGACESARRSRAYVLAQSIRRFLSLLAQAEHAFGANASWLGDMQPENLSDLENISDDLVRQVRVALESLQRQSPAKSIEPGSPKGHR